jgi:hypothetical protein
MKFNFKAALLLFSGIVTFNANAQLSIDFDNYTSAENNDYQNYFYDSDVYTLTQNGITGRALSCSNTTDVNSDGRLIYHRALVNEIGVTNKVSVSFKYDSSLKNPNSNDDAVQLTFSVNNYSNEQYGDRMYFSISHDNKLLASAANVFTRTDVIMEDGHWYKLTGSSSVIGGSFGDQVDVKAELFDLGVSGLSSPVSIGSSEGSAFNQDYVTSDKIQVSLLGTKWGGADLLDNFEIVGTLTKMFGLHVSDVSIVPFGVARTRDYQVTLNWVLGGWEYYNDSNVFIIELSDKQGSFTSPKGLDSLKSTIGNSTIEGYFDSSTALGNGYKIRVRTTHPQDTTISDPFEIHTATSVSELLNLPSINQYYSVFEETLIVTVENEKVDVEVSVYSLDGSLLHLESLQAGINSIDVSSLSAGSYVCQITSAGEFLHSAIFIKQ